MKNMSEREAADPPPIFAVDLQRSALSSAVPFFLQIQMNPGLTLDSFRIAF